MKGMWHYALFSFVLLARAIMAEGEVTASVTFGAFVLLARAIMAEEQHSVMTSLSQTTLSGYVDTSAVWSATLPPPENDNFANAATVSPGKIDLSTNLHAATLEPSEPVSPEQTGSIWFRWTPSASGKARLSAHALQPYISPNAVSTTPALSPESIFYPGGGITYGSVFTWNDSPNFLSGYGFSVYRGTSLADLIPVPYSLGSFEVQAGETIWVAMEIYPLGFFGPYPSRFYLDLTTPPINDSFANGLSISESAAGKLSGHLLGATREVLEPDLPNLSGPSVWFHYTAATYGRVAFSASEASFAIFTGDQLSNLKLIASTTNGSLSFFGEPDVVYHLAVYAAPEFGFELSFTAPIYRLYETTVAQLFPNGLIPHFHGLRGNTLLLYAKTESGWRCVEIEPIKDQATQFLIRPTAIDGQLRVLSIDDELPSPRVKFRAEGTRLIPELTGFPGQSCAVSYSTDLINWSTPTIHTLNTPTRALPAIDSPNTSVFYRVTQSFPATGAPKREITSTTTTAEPAPQPTSPQTVTLLIDLLSRRLGLK